MRRAGTPLARPPVAARGRQLAALTGLRFPLAAWVLLDRLTGRGIFLDSG